MPSMKRTVLGWSALLAVTMGWAVIAYGTIEDPRRTPWKCGVVIVGAIAPIGALLWPIIRYRRGYRGRQLLEGGIDIWLPLWLSWVIGLIGVLWILYLLWRMWSMGMW